MSLSEQSNDDYLDLDTRGRLRLYLSPLGHWDQDPCVLSDLSDIQGHERFKVGHLYLSRGRGVIRWLCSSSQRGKFYNVGYSQEETSILRLTRKSFRLHVPLLRAKYWVQACTHPHTLCGQALEHSFPQNLGSQSAILYWPQNHLALSIDLWGEWFIAAIQHLCSWIAPLSQARPDFKNPLVNMSTIQ